MRPCVLRSVKTKYRHIQLGRRLIDVSFVNVKPRWGFFCAVASQQNNKFSAIFDPTKVQISTRIIMVWVVLQLAFSFFVSCGRWILSDVKSHVMVWLKLISHILMFLCLCRSDWMFYIDEIYDCSTFLSSYKFIHFTNNFILSSLISFVRMPIFNIDREGIITDTGM